MKLTFEEFLDWNGICEDWYSQQKEWSQTAFFFRTFLGHYQNFLLNVRNIWSHFGQNVQKNFAYSTTMHL